MSKNLTSKERGLKGYIDGKSFEDEVSTIYRLLGFNVTQDVLVGGVQIDLIIKQNIAGFPMLAAVECKNNRVTAKERDQILAQKLVLQKEFPAYQCICVSAIGYAPDTRIALESAGIVCLTYTDLLKDLLPLENYINNTIFEYESWVNERWRGRDCYIRPYLLADFGNEKQEALKYINSWINDLSANLLIILGDLGTGKSTLASFLAYNFAKNYLDAPFTNPIPIIIPLKEVRKEVSLEGIIVSHFSQRGFKGISVPRFEHLLRLGKLLIIFDAFDEMSERWDVTYNNFKELSRAAEQKAKIILTCRTHYFKDRSEQSKIINDSLNLSPNETELYKKLRQRSNAEVVYLEEFNVNQIKEYLSKVRPENVVEDWERIKSVYNLEELAQRPLLLDMIVQSLDSFKSEEHINASSLYTVYTKIWLEREEEKGRLLNKHNKRELIMELAWQMWDKEEIKINYKGLIPFIQRLPKHKVEHIDEDLETIAREMQAASFLKRDKDGQFSFVHQSFMEFFIACKIYEDLNNPENSSNTVLETRRFDRKIVYFLTLLDEKDQLVYKFKRILSKGYIPKVSENALQILYWDSRNRLNMEKGIDDVQVFQNFIGNRLPEGIRLERADLHGMVLEAVKLTNGEFKGANLTSAILNNAYFQGGDLSYAKLANAQAENLIAIKVDFRKADLNGVSFTNSTLEHCRFDNSDYQESDFWGTSLKNSKGIVLSSSPNLDNLVPFLKHPHNPTVMATNRNSRSSLVASGDDNGAITVYDLNSRISLESKSNFQLKSPPHNIYTIQISTDQEMLATGSNDGIIRLWNIKNKQQIGTLKGHERGVNSVCISTDGKRLASGGNDKKVALWDLTTNKLIQIIEAHSKSITSVDFSTTGDELISGSNDNTVKLWDVKSGNCLKVLDSFHCMITSVHFSPVNNLVGIGGANGKIWIGDLNNAWQVIELPGHEKFVSSVSFSSDGKMLVSADVDGIIMLWDTINLKCSKVLKDNNPKQIYDISFGSNGKFLICATDIGCLQFWSIEEGRLVLSRYTFTPYEWVDLAPNGEFNASNEGLRYLYYKQPDSENIIPARKFSKHFYKPQEISNIINKYIK